MGVELEVWHTLTVVEEDVDAVLVPQALVLTVVLEETVLEAVAEVVAVAVAVAVLLAVLLSVVECRQGR